MTDKTKPRRALTWDGRPVYAFRSGVPRRAETPAGRGPFREDDAHITVGSHR